MQCNARNLVLLGRVDSGKSLLTELFVGGEGARRNNLCREVDIKLTPDEPAAVDRNRICLDIVREQTTETYFIVVVDINKSVEFGNELVSLKELSEYLSEYSYSLFGNCMIVFTHIDELPAEFNRGRVAQQEFEEILSLVDNRCMFLNCTDRSKENRDRALDEIVQLSKPSLRILCYGNDGYESESFLPNLFGEISENMYLYRAPDLNIFDPFEHKTTPELMNLVGDQERIGKGVSVFVILISQSEIFSRSMLDLIKRIPYFLELDAESESYFWDRVLIVFDTKGRENPDKIIRDSINGNIGIKDIVETAGGRCTYVSLSENESLSRIVMGCQEIVQTNFRTEFIGGRDVCVRARNYAKLHVPIRQTISKIYKHKLAGLLLGVAIFGGIGYNFTKISKGFLTCLSNFQNIPGYLSKILEVTTTFVSIYSVLGKYCFLPNMLLQPPVFRSLQSIPYVPFNLLGNLLCNN